MKTADLIKRVESLGLEVNSLFYDELLDVIEVLTDQLQVAMRKGPINTDEIEKHEKIIRDHKILVDYFNGILASK